MPDPVAIFTKEYYDRLKEIEAAHWWTLGMTDLMEAVLRGRLPEPAGSCFLDVGCGSGIGLAWAGRRLPGARRVGVDVSEHGLEHCRDLGAELHLAGAERLPLADGSVDLAICIDVLQHLDDDRKALAEMRRVLRPSGMLYLRTNARGLRPPPPGSHLYTRRLLLERLGGAGFDVATCSPANFLGGVVAELKPRRGAGAHHDPHHHDHDHDHHHHDHPQPAPGGGGYGGGLSLAAEQAGPGSRLKRASLRLEGRLIRRGLRLPFGHSLVALARPAKPR